MEFVDYLNKFIKVINLDFPKNQDMFYSTTVSLTTLCLLHPPHRYVFISQKAYQDSETRPESSVYTRMTGIALQGDRILDMVEYVQPPEVSPQDASHTTVFYTMS